MTLSYFFFKVWLVYCSNECDVKTVWPTGGTIYWLLSAVSVSAMSRAPLYLKPCLVRHYLFEVEGID
jgi:hypothetical protein